MNHLKILEDVSKKVALSTISMSPEERTTTGLNVMDLMLGGGIAPSWITYAGPEQSAKTTFALQVLLTHADTQKIPIKVLWDAEQSTGQSLDYVVNIYEQIHGAKKAAKITAADIFGQRDKNGKFVIEPRVYYRDDHDGEKFFNWCFTVFSSLPDKRNIGGKWYYVHEVTAENKRTLKGAYDVEMSTKNGGLLVPAEDGSPQVIILTDSLPALVPPTMMDGEGSNQLAQGAAMFAKHAPRIQGFLGKKRIVFMCINQLRNNPGARFSSPVYEPLGEAIKFFSSVRLWFWPNALSTAPFNPKGEGQIETEPSVTVEGGEDQYRYVKVTVKKNKLSAHVKETWLRLWIQDGDGRAMGFDPVWDCFWYGQMTGQIIGNRKKMAFNIEGLDTGNVSINWVQLKKLILTPKSDESLAIFTKLGIKKPIDIRAGFRRQIVLGEGYDLLVKHVIAARKTKVDPDADE